MFVVKTVLKLLYKSLSCWHISQQRVIFSNLIVENKLREANLMNKMRDVEIQTSIHPFRLLQQ